MLWGLWVSYKVAVGPFSFYSFDLFVSHPRDCYRTALQACVFWAKRPYKSGHGEACAKSQGLKVGTEVPLRVVNSLLKSWTHSPCPLPAALYNIKYCVLYDYPLFCDYLPRAEKKKIRGGGGTGV